MTKDFIVALNYAYKYGKYDPQKNKKEAYLEFGKYAEDSLLKTGKPTPNGLNGVWWDEVKQFVEPGIIDWSWTNKLFV
jgi:hypothetical protein